MELKTAIQQRRSVRKFQEKSFPDEFVQEALELATLAPNSSNTQTWNFAWVKSDDYRRRVAEACLSQSAARTAQHLIVVSADPKLWRRSQGQLLKWVESSKTPSAVHTYYSRLVPFMYRWGLFNSLGLFKWILFWTIGWFRPIMRGPCFRSDQEMVAVKSAALAAQNFVLAIESLGGSTCMMEGFDENRVKRLLKLSPTSRVAMVIAVGYKDEKGIWGDRFRLGFDDVVRRF